ncbi:PE-PPE domain-containing protein [Mycolicibacterium confluentis]|uniref:PE-PPE domain-containing protein n=1 Tax=Mycolicibacterium confluentis TaxID=28047 RepID=A0A7I7Y0V0_9MYCO|nr:PE-PPE domain-containing protein [Mycolicibacterium confluentis]BBZ35290.1 PE-PPE domain-containing protein [Mycolicibacterium confluentis]
MTEIIFGEAILVSGGFRRACVPAFVGSVALTTALGVGAVATTAPPAPVSRGVDLTALITHGSATNWNADGIDKFYGLDWYAKYVPEGGDRVVSKFSLFPYNVNPDNLKAALRNNVGDAEPDLVLTSGRGSGAATVTMLLLLGSGNQEDRDLVLNTRWILDNNVNRPNGGYGSRYIPFTILGVYPWPTPTDEGVDIVDVGYEYAWNSSAPAYVTNVVALLNSIIAYAYRYKSQAFTGLPEDPEHPGAKDPITGEPVLEKGYHYIVEVDGTVTKVPLDSKGNTNTAYVTYRANGLPMLQPLRDWGGKLGNMVADFLQPALKVIVDASYPDNDPVANPDRYITASLFTPPDVAVKALKKLPDAIREGFDNLKKDLGITPSPTTSNLPSEPKTDDEGQVSGLSDTGETAAELKARWKSTLGPRNRITTRNAAAANAAANDNAADGAADRAPRTSRIADRVAKVLSRKGSQNTEAGGGAASPSEGSASQTGGDES